MRETRSCQSRGIYSWGPCTTLQLKSKQGQGDKGEYLAPKEVYEKLAN